MERHLTLTEAVQRIRERVLAAWQVVDTPDVDVVVVVRSGDEAWDVDGVRWPGLGLVVLELGQPIRERWLGAVDDDAVRRLVAWVTAADAREAA